MLFFSLWEELVADFNGALPRPVLAGLQKLRAVPQGFFPRGDVILNSLQAFVETLMVPCLEGTPFVGRDALHKPRQWSMEAVDWVHSLGLLVNRLRQARDSMAPVPVPTIEALLSFVRKGVRAWNRFDLMDVREKCFALSAYSYGLAEGCEWRGQYGMALLLSHRALDLYFCFCAFGHGELTENANGFEYSGPDRAFAVNLLLTFRILRNTGFFAHGLAIEPDVIALNDARNLHLLTHYVYGITEAEVRRLRGSVSNIVRSIEGPAGFSRWALAGGEWLPLPQIEAGCLFEVEPSIASYLAARAVPGG